MNQRNAGGGKVRARVEVKGAQRRGAAHVTSVSWKNPRAERGREERYEGRGGSRRSALLKSDKEPGSAGGWGLSSRLQGALKDDERMVEEREVIPAGEKDAIVSRNQTGA